MTEQDILKYLDNELSNEERKAFEEKLFQEPDLKRRLEEVIAKRRDTLEAIGSFDPSGAAEVPDFNSLPQPGKKRKLFISRWWKVAAAVLILVAASIAFFNHADQKPEIMQTAENTSIQQTEEPEYCSELDYYISPNRCWNRRELVYTYVNLDE